MNKPEYPKYVDQMLAEARMLLEEDDLTQPDAAAIGFDVLALFPDCQEASDLIMEAFSDPWLIWDYRKALSCIIDEWDDRPWQQRRRLARSYGYTSRWDGRYREYDENVNPEDICPADVKAMLEEGHHQLLQDYLLGQSQGSDAAWPIFQEAIKRTNDPATAMFWVAQTYADSGYFAESVEVLDDLLAQYPDDQDARRVRAEVCWWRDHQEQIPWIPPNNDGNGRRWRQIMRQTDEEFAANEELYTKPLDFYFPPDADQLPQDFTPPAPIPPDLVAQIEAALGDPSPTQPSESRVDWGYLDKLESGDIDVDTFPLWAQQLLRDIEESDYKQYLIQYLIGHLSNPPIDGTKEDDE